MKCDVRTIRHHRHRHTPASRLQRQTTRQHDDAVRTMFTTLPFGAKKNGRPGHDVTCGHRGNRVFPYGLSYTSPLRRRAHAQQQQKGQVEGIEKPSIAPVNVNNKSQRLSAARGGIVGATRARRPTRCRRQPSRHARADIATPGARTTAATPVRRMTQRQRTSAAPHRRLSRAPGRGPTFAAGMEPGRCGGWDAGSSRRHGGRNRRRLRGRDVGGRESGEQQREANAPLRERDTSCYLHGYHPSRPRSAGRYAMRGVTWQSRVACVSWVSRASPTAPDRTNLSDPSDLPDPRDLIG
jgi:hypothetical protein